MVFKLSALEVTLPTILVRHELINCSLTFQWIANGMPGVHGALAQNHVVLGLDNDQGVTSRKRGMAVIIAQESLLPPKLAT